MATERRAQALLRALADESVPLEDAATLDRRRRRVVEATALAIARAANDGAKKRRWARAATVFASAAAIVAVAGVGWRLRTRPVGSDRAPAFAVGEAIVGALHRKHQGDPLPQSDPMGHLPLRAGDEVATEPGGRGEVILADGVAITLESDTELTLPDLAMSSSAGAREVVGLARGGVSVHVPPMSAGHTFSVTTPDAEVTVHGTSFTVEVLRPAEHGGTGTSATAEAETRVRVTTGVVSVSSRGREALLRAGMEWSSPVEGKMQSGGLTPAISEREEAPTPITKTTTAAPRTARHQGTASATPPPRSRLGEENQLLAAAIAESKGGDFAGAVATLDDLLRRFPTSTLAQEAHVERFRALAHGDHSAAAREARSYLALYPDGFARDEAKGLAVEW